MSQSAIQSSGIPVRAAPGAAAAAVAWRQGGRLFVTAIAKATFQFVQDGPMRRTRPQEIVQRDLHHANNPARSVRIASDLSPWLLRADVVLTGHAHAPSPGVRTMVVRLGVFSDMRPLLDRSLLVSSEAGIDRVPLVHENAYGGVGCEENPLGVGAGDDARRPLLLDTTDPTRPACLGPIGLAWPGRRRLLGATPRGRLEAPIADLPDDIDWQYFQAAPRDQQIGYLRGDEWIVVDGVHPTEPRVRVRLPGARGMARVHGLSGAGTPDGTLLVLRADTLRIDADEQTCTVVWRNRFAVPDEAALQAVRIVAGVELPDEPIAWPEPAGDGPASSPAPEEPSPTSTVFLGGAAPQAARPVMPFRPGEGSALHLPSPPPPSPGEHPQRGRTLALPPDEEVLVAARSPLPFSTPPPALPAAQAPAERIAPLPPAVPADLAAGADGPRQADPPRAGATARGFAWAEVSRDEPPAAPAPPKVQRPRVAPATHAIQRGLYGCFAPE